MSGVDTPATRAASIEPQVKKAARPSPLGDGRASLFGDGWEAVVERPVARWWEPGEPISP